MPIKKPTGASKRIEITNLNQMGNPIVFWKIIGFKNGIKKIRHTNSINASLREMRALLWLPIPEKSNIVKRTTVKANAGCPR